MFRHKILSMLPWLLWQKSLSEVVLVFFLDCWPLANLTTVVMLQRQLSIKFLSKSASLLRLDRNAWQAGFLPVDRMLDTPALCEVNDLGFFECFDMVLTWQQWHLFCNNLLQLDLTGQHPDEKKAFCDEKTKMRWAEHQLWMKVLKLMHQCYKHAGKSIFRSLFASTDVIAESSNCHVFMHWWSVPVCLSMCSSVWFVSGRHVTAQSTASHKENSLPHVNPAVSATNRTSDHGMLLVV